MKGLHLVSFTLSDKERTTDLSLENMAEII